MALAAAVACGPLVAGCAGTPPRVERDMAQLREELASQRRAHRELVERMERLEARLAVTGAGAAKAPPGPSRSGRARDALPLVRLSPRHNPVAAAPPVDTSIPLREPPDEELAALAGEGAADLSALVESFDEEAGLVFSEALRLYHAGDLGASRAAFETFAERHPRHRSAPDALYLAGMAQVQSRRCDEASPLFDAVLEEYGRSDAARRSLLALGQCAAENGDGERARALLRRLVREHPRTPEAKQAESALKKLARPVESGDRRSSRQFAAGSGAA